MNAAQRTIRLETATFNFLSQNEGSYIVKVRRDEFIVQVSGMSREALRWHRRATVYTLGLWLPILLVVFLVTRPYFVSITVDIHGHPIVRHLT